MEKWRSILQCRKSLFKARTLIRWMQNKAFCAKLVVAKDNME